jgi:hypothetical protein
MVENDETRAREARIRLLSDAHRRFGEFAEAHLPCHGTANWSGNNAVTIMKCHACLATCEVDLPIAMYLDYLETELGWPDQERKKMVMAPGGDKPS